MIWQGEALGIKGRGGGQENIVSLKGRIDISPTPGEARGPEIPPGWPVPSHKKWGQTTEGLIRQGVLGDW